LLRASLAAFDESGLPSVAEVNQRTGLSPKRLLALFRDEVGLSPKAYWRVRRFRAALRDINRGVLRGADLAAQHGYCDQAHFLREFRQLSGSTPREYRAARRPQRPRSGPSVKRSNNRTQV
jgi:AraC-like DNA-binding protein